MRNDLNILWIDDAQRWQKEQNDILKMDIEEMSISSNIQLVNKGKDVLEDLKKQEKGFKIYDIIIIDYSLSNGVVGDSVIALLRSNKVDCDILFYSADKKNDLKQIIFENGFEGIYLCNRENFRDKVISLIEKNVRKQTSISNIRGLLMDQTSENDYIINSYILTKYSGLSGSQKEEINKFILTEINLANDAFVENYQRAKKELESKDISNINKFLKLPNYILPLELKYRIFEKIANYTGEIDFKRLSVDDYFCNVVNKRNTIAHKKLDICAEYKYIKYFDNINQFNARKCPEDCPEECDMAISLEDWNNLRKLLYEYALFFNNVNDLF